jgi:hypothetical protein
LIKFLPLLAHHSRACRCDPTLLQKNVVVKLRDFVDMSMHDWIRESTLSPVIDNLAMA